MKHYNFNHLILILMSVCLASCAETIPFPIAWKLQEVQPIECYLHFVDQNGQAVSNAAVEAKVVTKQSDAATEDIKVLSNVKTDSGGFLHISGERGGALFLRINDAAYLHGSPYPGRVGGITLKYSKISHEGNRNYGSKEKPAVYLVWRKEGLQPLIALTGNLQFPFNEHSIHIDLEKGALVDNSSDINIEIKIPETDKERRALADHRGLFPYECTLSTLKGKLKPYDCMEDTYYDLFGISTLENSVDTIHGEGSLGYPQGKFIKFEGLISFRSGSANGKIKLQVSVDDIRRGNGDIIINIDDSLLNFTGSRSLEVDPTRLTKLTLTDARKKPDVEQNKLEPVKP